METDDKYIIEAVKRGSREGFSLLMKRYGEPVYWHIRRLVVSHSDAQDAAQETFIRVFRNIDQLQQSVSLRSWIMRIATNEALRLIAYRRQEQVSLDCNAAQTGMVMAEEYVDYTDLEAITLQKAILALPTKQQLAFNLRYYDGLSYEEIALACGSTAAAAKSNYYLAKQKVTQYLHDNE